MIRFIVTRLVLSVPVMLGVVTIMFIVSRMMPGDPAALAAGQQAGREAVVQIRHEMGLDLPLPLQYVRFVAGAARGDLGTSVYTHRTVVEDLGDYLPASMELALFAMLIALAVGIPTGVLSAIKPNSTVDQGSRLTALFGICMPVFWVGLLLQWMFYKNLDLLPSVGRLSVFMMPPDRVTGFILVDSLLAGNWTTLLDGLKHILLPAVTLSLTALATVSRMTRSTMIEVLGQDYIRTARAKGIRERLVLSRHALRNALNPIVTLAGLQFGYLIGRAFLVEAVFSWPGMGRYAVGAITNLDYNPIMGVALVIALIFVIVNLVVDTLYVWIDPRVKYGAAR